MSGKESKSSFTCEACNVHCMSEICLNEHLKGKNHKKKVKLLGRGLEQKGQEHALEKRVNVCKEDLTIWKTNGVSIEKIPEKMDRTQLLNMASEYGEVKELVFVNKSLVKILFVSEESAKVMLRCKPKFDGKYVWVSPAARDIKVDLRPGSICIKHNDITEALKPDLNFDQELAVLNSQLFSKDLERAANRVRNNVCTTLGHLIRDVDVYTFGSVLTGLAMKGSDIDLFIDVSSSLQRYRYEQGNEPVYEKSRDDQSLLNSAFKALKKNNMQFAKVFMLKGAKVPIIKAMHQPTAINCDISFKSYAGVQNSLVIKYFLSFDSRVKQLLVILKYWLKYFELSKPGSFSCYGLIMMVFYYLQQLDEPMLPTIYLVQSCCPKKLFIDQWDYSFSPACKVPINPIKNVSTILELLLGFFEFFSKFDFGLYVICPLIGKALLKNLFHPHNHSLLPPEMALYHLNHDHNNADKGLKTDSLICVQDPFLLNRNVTGCGGSFHKVIIDMFKSSALVLNEKLATSNIKGLVKHLFQQRTKDILMLPWVMNKELGSVVSQKIIINMELYSKAVHLESNVEAIQSVWYKDTVELIIKLLQRICKFQTEEVRRDNEPSQKVQKLDSDTNVKSTGSNNEVFRVIKCSSTLPSVREKRRLMKNLGPELSFIERQETISDRMLEIKKPELVEEVDFKCNFIFRRNPTTYIVLEVSNVATNKSVFSLWCSFLKTQLPDWVRKAQREESSSV